MRRFITGITALVIALGITAPAVASTPKLTTAEARHQTQDAFAYNMRANQHYGVMKKYSRVLPKMHRINSSTIRGTFYIVRRQGSKYFGLRGDTIVTKTATGALVRNPDPAKYFLATDCPTVKAVIDWLDSYEGTAFTQKMD